MKKLPIKGTSMAFSLLGLGTGTGFNKNLGKSQKDLFNAFDSCLESGVNWVDTAESYANGYAEELIGNYSKLRKKNFFVATKFSPINAPKKKLKRACEASLKRLKKDCIDLYQIHWMNYSVPIEETIETLISLKNEGKIRAIGVCNFSKEEIANCDSDLLVSNQIEFNLSNRVAEKKLIPFHKKKDLTTIAYSPFDGVKDLLPKSKKKKILDSLITKYSATYFQIVLSFLTNYRNMLVTYSSTNSNHIIENTNLLNIEKKDFKIISDIFISSELFIDPQLIKIPSDKYKKFYNSLQEAESNEYKYFPDINELSKEFLINNNFKPIKVKCIEDKHFKFELTGGMLRYWAWIKTFNNKKYIPAIITNS